MTRETRGRVRSKKNSNAAGSETLFRHIGQSHLDLCVTELQQPFGDSSNSVRARNKDRSCPDELTDWKVQRLADYSSTFERSNVRTFQPKRGQLLGIAT